jgi:monoamine oxidase
MNASKYDVLVVGAGAAGLAAGRALAAAGRRVAIVEARARVGGRIFTQHFPAGNSGAPIAVELGAEFIHGLPRATWALTEEAGLKTYELQGTQLRFAAGRLMAHGDQEDVSRDVLEEMTARVAKGADGRDMTFAEYLERNKVDAQRSESAANYVEGFNAADRTRIGIAGLAKQQRAEDAIDADRLFRLTAGYSAIPTYLAEEFTRSGGNLMLGTPVQSVAWKRGAVAVRFRDAAGGDFQLHADRAVISIPLGVLQAESIDFAPRPAEILAQAHRLVMGEVVRVVLLFRTRFWSERPWAAKQRKLGSELDHWSFLFTPSEVPATWWTPMPDRTPMITAWVGGPKAAALLRSITSTGDRYALLDQCLTSLAKVFDVPVRDLEMLLLSWHTHDWQSDEYALGAYSYVPAGALDAPERMTIPVEDTLYFTGEHTDTTGHWGTVHAALEAGMFAARQVLTGPVRRSSAGVR